MLTNKNIGFLGLFMTLSACGGSDRTGVDTLFDTSRHDVVAYEAEGAQVGLFNTTHLLAWDYELGYTGFETNGSIEFGPVVSIPQQRLQAYLAADQTAERADAVISGGGGGGGGFMCPNPIPPPSTSCDANYCCTTTSTCFTTTIYCTPRIRR